MMLMASIRYLPLGPLLTILACASCSPPPASVHPSDAASPDAGAPDAASPPDAGAPTPATSAPWPRYPTLENAGAAACKPARTVALGPIEGDAPIVGFGPAGGLAAWRPNNTSLILQPITAAGVTGTTVTVALDSDLTVERIHALRGGLIVVIRRWDWQKKIARWWGLPVGYDAHPLGARVDLGLADMDILLHQIIDDERVALLLFPAAIAPARDRLQHRWQTLTLGAGGVIESKRGGDLGHVEMLSSDTWEPATLGQRRGWAVFRDGVLQPEGIFDGQRMKSAGATSVRPNDAIDARVYSLAVPPPRGPGGRIYEALPQPALVREHRGKRVGTPFDLSSNNHTDLNDAVWSGTYFVHASRDHHHEPATAALTFIDCAP
ncbi:Hypothetical protein A7982_03208 [Minicystis rosea]|nr:Hypothetical protein A7982_03208 [Minicystis rosea]